MAAPTPTDEIVAARAVLRRGALPAIERRLMISVEVVERLAADGIAQSLEVLGAIDAEHAGWALLGTGIRVAESADMLGHRGRRRSDTAFSVGVLWAGVVTAAAGDRLLTDAGQLTVDPAWAPGADAHGARQLAEELSRSSLDLVSSPEDLERFQAETLTGLDAELADLDRGPAGWMLCTFGIWVGRGIGRVAAPLLARNGLGLRRVTKPRRAIEGTALAGALLSQTGIALLDAAGEPTARRK